MKTIRILRDILETTDARLLVEGIGLVLIVGSAFFFLWKWFASGHYARTLCLIVILGFGLRATSASDRFLHNWDERYHALVAKNMR
jgi:4-amino-4-deoxy-L-arabinose transferase